MRPRYWCALMAVALATSACGSSSPVASLAAPSSSPFAAPSASEASVPSAPASAGASDPYTLTLPSGWIAFDPSSPSSKAAFDALAGANPALAPMINTFETSKLYKLSINQLTGDVIVTAALPTQGMTLAQIGQALGAQFAAVPGASGIPAPDPTTLPAGDALHWPITFSANKATGGAVSVTESVYLVSNGENAVIVEFVTPSGGVPADEATILNSLEFR